MASIVTLNGSQIFPSDISMKLTKIGKVQVSANGARTFLHRTLSGTPIFKRQWDLSFQGITNTRRTTIETLALVTTTMTLVDELGVSYTVQTEESAYEKGIGIIAKPSALTLYYNVKLTIWEA